MSRFDRVTIPNPRIVGPGLNAPGVASPPPDLREAAGFEAATGLLGVTGGIAAVLNNLAEQDLDAQRRAEYEAEKAVNETALYEQGLGAKHAKAKHVQIQSDISEGRLKVPADMSPTEFAASIIDEDTEGFSPAYRQGYEEQYEEIVRTAIASKALDRKKDLDTKIDLSANTLFGPNATADQAREVVATLRAEFPETTDDEIRALTIVPAAKLHAEAGNVAKARELLSALPDGSFRAERLKVGQIAAAAAASQQAETDRAFQNQMAALRNANAPMPMLEAAVNAAAAEGSLVQPNVVEVERIANKQEESRRLQRITQAQKDLSYQQQFQSSVGTARAMLSGGYTVGEIPAFDDATLPDGSTKTIQSKEVIDRAVDDQMAQIANLNRADPVALRNAQFDFLANSGATYRAWRNEWQGIAGRLSSLPVDSKVVLDEPTKAAVQRFRQLRSELRGGVIDAHMDPVTKRYMNDLAVALESRAGGSEGGDADWAEAIARVNSKSNRTLLNKRNLTPNDKLVDESAEALADSLGVDTGSRRLGDAINAKAQQFLDSNPDISPDQAVKQAEIEVANEFVSLDGMPAGVRGRINKAEAPAVEAIIPAIKSYWRETTSKGRNASADLDYRLAINEASGNFGIVSVEGGAVTGRYDAEFAITSDDLASLARWNAQRETQLEAATKIERGSLTVRPIELIRSFSDPRGIGAAFTASAPDPKGAAMIRERANARPRNWSPLMNALADRITTQPSTAPAIAPTLGNASGALF